MKKEKQQIIVLQGVCFFAFGQSLASWFPLFPVTPCVFPKFPSIYGEDKQSFYFWHLNTRKKKKEKKLFLLYYCIST